MIKYKNQQNIVLNILKFYKKKKIKYKFETSLMLCLAWSVNLRELICVDL